MSSEPVSAEASNRQLVVEIVKRGWVWYGHRSIVTPGTWVDIDVMPPLVAWSPRRIERKARRWIRREERTIEHRSARYTITAAATTEKTA